MGVAEHHARRALLATKNAPLDEIFSYIEQHENDSEFNKPLEESNTDGIEENKKKRKKPRQIPLEIQRLFTMLKLVDQETVSTQGRYSMYSMVVAL